MCRGGELPSACVRAVIDTPSDTPPGSDWLFCFGHGGFLQMVLGAVGGARGACFFSQIICLMYCQDILTVVANMTYGLPTATLNSM